MATSFIDCTSLSINFNVMGLATVTYTIVTDVLDLNQIDGTLPLSAGGKVFRGHVTNASITQIQGTDWYEIHVTAITTAN